MQVFFFFFNTAQNTFFIYVLLNMDVYSVDAKDLSTYIKHKRKISNSKKPKNIQGNLIGTCRL